MLQQSQSGPASLAPLFHALSDPSRLDIVERLSEGPATVSAIAGAYPMSLSAVLQHLRILEKGGIVRTEKHGRVRTCRLEAGALRLVEDWVARRRTALQHRLDRLETYLDQEQTP